MVRAAATRLPAACSAIARFTAVCGAYSVRQRGASGRTTGQARRIAGARAAAAAAGTAAESVPATVNTAPAAMAILLILMWLLPGLLIGMNWWRIRCAHRRAAAFWRVMTRPGRR